MSGSMYGDDIDIDRTNEYTRLNKKNFFFRILVGPQKKIYIYITGTGLTKSDGGKRASA